VNASFALFILNIRQTSFVFAVDYHPIDFLLGGSHTSANNVSNTVLIPPLPPFHPTVFFLKKNVLAVRRDAGSKAQGVARTPRVATGAQIAGMQVTHRYCGT